MTLISDLHGVHPDRGGAHRPDAPAPGRRSSRAPIVDTCDTVVALHRRECLAHGGLAERAIEHGARLVAATDRSGRQAWVPASAVWSDADAPQPQQPHATGLATSRDADRAVLAGLSDRLGREAVDALDRGAELPRLDTADGIDVAHVVALDGRLGHGVPTILLLGEGMLRWGAGATWAAAAHRALYGHDQGADPTAELETIGELLSEEGLTTAVVDLGSEILHRAGIVRCSVQVLTV